MNTWPLWIIHKSFFLFVVKPTDEWNADISLKRYKAYLPVMIGWIFSMWYSKIATSVDDAQG